MKYDDDDDDDDLSKILKVIDNTSQRSTTMSCFWALPWKADCPYNRRWSEQQLIWNTTVCYFIEQKSWDSYQNFCSECPPRASMHACNLRR